MSVAPAERHNVALPPPRPDHPPHNNSNSNTHPHTTHAPITVPVNTAHMQPRRRTMITSTSGDWSLGKTIGAGSMGKVKLARHTVTGEQVAIKIIPRYSTEEHRSARDMERADRSKEIRTAREAAIVTLLHHPYVCGMRDVVRTNYHWYMLFEYVNGGQMLDYIISHGKLKEKQARKFARQVASALDYCHRNSIVHRDLKIENILISNTGDIKIIDFGLSNLFNPASKLKTFCGSLYFAAPELLQARQYTGPEVDIWSFGVVLYVLVCGKVPFDDQSMPQLHAKIKKGQTEYPPSLTADCRHLISRMLVTDPTQRATLHEVMNHPWMTKGYNGPPENYLPIREPLQLPLDPEIVQLMTGFDFGPTEVIAAQLTHVIESEEYQTAVRSYLSQTAASASASGISSTAGDARKKSVFDFYKRRNSTSKDALSAASVEAVPLGMDPLNAFNPLISVYCLVKEKRDRDRAAAAAAIIASERGSAASMPGVPALPRNHGEQQLRMASSTATAVPDLSVSAASPIREPESARVKPTGYNLAGDREPSNIATRNRPRARTHGDNEVPAMTGEKFLQQQKREPTSTPPTPQTQPSPQPQPQPQPQQQQQQPEQHHKKENVAVGLLRRFSTRKKLRVQTQTQPLQVQHPELTPTSAPPQVNIQPAEEVTQPRRSFGMRRSPWRGRERDASPSSANSGSSNQAHTPPKEAPAAQPELLSPRAPTHRTSASKLTRSASVNSADQRIRQAIPENGTVPETTTSGSGSSAGPQPDNSPSERNATPTTNIRRNQSTKTTSPAFGNTTSVSSSGGNGILPRRAHTFRARSLGNARRESIQLRRSRRSEANAREADVPEEPSTDVEGPRHGGRRVGDANAAGRAGGANDRYDRAASNDPEPSTSTTSDELAKPVYLKGLFSVSTTSTKSFSFIRADIKRVLAELGVQYHDIKGGFSCRKVPSIDLVQSPQATPANPPAADTPASPSSGHHRHRISFAGLRQERGENDAPELKHSRSMRRHQGPPDRSFITNSEGSEEYVAHAPPAVAPNNTNSHAAETTTRIRDDKGGNMILKFEVLIVKVPLFSLHGIQFKKISGGMWQYKEMAKKILDELKL